jgi:hypothetical protein
MKRLIFPALVGLLLFTGCKKAQESEEAKSSEPTVTELQRMLEAELTK